LPQKYLNKCTGNTQKIYTAAIESQHLRYAPELKLPSQGSGSKKGEKYSS
jgi:hypothetical protein